MNAEAMSLDEIMGAGHDALYRELGPVGAMRFLQQLAPGR